MKRFSGTLAAFIGLLFLAGIALAWIEPISEQMQTWSEADKMNFVRPYSVEYQSVKMRISAALMQKVQNQEYMELFIEHMKNMPSPGPGQ